MPQQQRRQQRSSPTANKKHLENDMPLNKRSANAGTRSKKLSSSKKESLPVQSTRSQQKKRTNSGSQPLILPTYLPTYRF